MLWIEIQFQIPPEWYSNSEFLLFKHQNLIQIQLHKIKFHIFEIQFVIFYSNFMFEIQIRFQIPPNIIFIFKLSHFRNFVKFRFNLTKSKSHISKSNSWFNIQTSHLKFKFNFKFQKNDIQIQNFILQNPFSCPNFTFRIQIQIQNFTFQIHSNFKFQFFYSHFFKYTIQHVDKFSYFFQLKIESARIKIE